MNCGNEARVYLATMEEDIGSHLNNEFLRLVKQFYYATLDKAFQCSPVDNPILKNMRVVLSERTVLKRTEFIEIAERLKNVKDKTQTEKSHLVTYISSHKMTFFTIKPRDLSPLKLADKEL